MPDLPARPDLGQLRRQAKDLLSGARAGDAAALERVRAVSDQLVLASAQLALARDDPARLRALLGEDPQLGVAPMERWCDHPRGASPLGYVAMLRYDTSRRVWRDVPGAGALARVLVDAGAPVDGAPGDRETPLITAASYGDAAVAGVLVEAGADLRARAAPDAGGVPGGTALLHAAMFGMTEVIDVLVAAGASPETIEEAAASGDLADFLSPQTPLQARVRALVMAADHQTPGGRRPAAGDRDARRRHRRQVGPAGVAHRCTERPGRQRRAPARSGRRPEPPRPAAPPHRAGVVPSRTRRPRAPQRP